MIGKILLEIVIVIFALIGFFGTLQWLLERLFGSDKLFIGIEILTQRDAESVEILIRDALFQYLRIKSNKVVIFTTNELANQSELKRVSKEYGVSCIVTQKITNESS